MVKYPSILYLPQPDINRQLYEMIVKDESGDDNSIKDLQDAIGSESTDNTILKRIKDIETSIGTESTEGSILYRIKVLETAAATGTVTVIALDGYEAEPVPLTDGMVVLATAPVDWSDPDTNTYVAGGDTFDETGLCTLVTTGNFSPNIPFGTYYLCATNTSQDIEYSGTLTVDGDEEVTITLTVPETQEQQGGE